MDARKWPDSLHWQYSMERLGDDEPGVWPHVPAATIAQRGVEPPRPVGTGFVVLVPL